MLYKNKNTNLVEEVKLFDTYVLVRSEDPKRFRDIKKLTHFEFLRDYEEVREPEPEEPKWYAGEGNVVHLRGKPN